MPDFEIQIEQYFENLELLCSGYSFKQPMELEVLTKLLTDVTPKLKSFHSLYPEKKIKDTPGDQLLNFMQSIHIFITKVNSTFTNNLLDAFDLIDKKLFQCLTEQQTQQEIINILNKITLPEFDFTFVRFFYSQIFQRWIDSDQNYFDQFLTDIQKFEELIPLIKDLFSEKLLNQITSYSDKEIDKNIGTTIEQVERRLLIIPVYLSEKLKSLLIDYVSLVHKFRDVLQLQYHLSSLSTDLLNKGVLFTNDFQGICKNQITLIRDIKKKIDQNKDLFSKYNVNEEIYNKMITDLEQMIFSHNNILDILNKPKTQQQISVDVLIKEEIEFIDLLKNNLNFFVPEIKQIFVKYINSMLYLIEWWQNTKKSLLQQSQIFKLMFESIQEIDKIEIIKNIKEIYFKSYFKDKKVFFSFIEETTADLLPIFDHFTAINKSIFNALQDISKWDLLLKVDPLKNSVSILDAVIQFFDRWKEESLKASFEAKLQVYNTDFKVFVEIFTHISSIFSEVQKKRFSKPKDALEQLSQVKKLVKESEKTIYNLFSSNLEVMKDIDKLTNDIETLHIIILHFDNVNFEIIENLGKSWDSVTFKPFLKILNEKINLFPIIRESFPNTEKLKVLTLFNFISSLVIIEDYLNDSMITSIMSINIFIDLISKLNQTKSVLLHLESLFPPNKKEVLSTFYKNVNNFFDVIAISWINIAKKTKNFVNLQSKRISIGNRKDLYNQFIDYQGTTIQFAFDMPVFENRFKIYDKEFYPKFKNYFYNLISLEDQWLLIIDKLNSNTNVDLNKKDLLKKIDFFFTHSITEEFNTDFFAKIDNLMRDRVAFLNNSTKESLAIIKMKELII